MSVLLGNLVELVKMIFACIVRPNYGTSNEILTLLNYLFNSNLISTSKVLPAILLLVFGIGLTGVSIGLLKRFLWKS